MDSNRKLFFVESSNKHYIRISNKIGSGGEGDVFNFEGQGGQNMCIKIYKDENVISTSTSTYNKLLKMTSHQAAMRFSQSKICWPVSIIYESTEKDPQRPVGYMMPIASSDTITVKSLFLPISRKKNLAHITRSDMCKFLEDWLTSLALLQKNNIIVGDINERNVLVDPNTLKSYLVDCDSFQIENLPCPVGTADYLAPELQGINLQKHLRTAEHENFAIAVFVFKALVGGVNPFAVVDGAGVAENIKNGNFPYTYAEIYQPKLTPVGSAKVRWAHLSMDLKGLFYQTFKQNKRATPSEWYTAIYNYRSLISYGHFTDSLDDLLDSSIDTGGKSTIIDDARQQKPKGEICNKINHTLFGPNIGVLELSTRAVKSMLVNAPSLWNGFKWKKPYFVNEAHLTHTGQLINHEKNMNLDGFKKTILPIIKKNFEFLKSEGCTHIYAIATAAYRGSKNNEEILSILKDIGLNVMILTRNQEADYTSKAFRWTQTKPQNYLNQDILLIDQGGGSTEVSLLDSQGHLIERGNIPLGTESATNSLYTNFTESRSFRDILTEAPKYLRKNVNDNTLDVVKAIGKRPNQPIIVALGTAITTATGKNSNASQHNTEMSTLTIQAFIDENLKTLQNQSTISNTKELYAYIDKVKGRKNNENFNYYDRLVH